MTAWLIVGGILISWVALGFVTLGLWIWLEPGSFEPVKPNGLRYPYSNTYEVATSEGEIETRRFYALGLPPLALIGLLSRRFMGVVLRSKRDKLRLRSELEKELDAAKKEIEDLLRASK